MYNTMKKPLVLLCLLAIGVNVWAQTISQRLEKAFEDFEKDSQMRSGISSLYVEELGSGTVVFSRNEKTGLAPASTQKIITAATAYELLGAGFRYQTLLTYDLGIRNGELLGNLYLEGSGDPTLGSFRWKETSDTAILRRVTGILKRKGVTRINGDIWIDDMKADVNPVPDGWIWQDMGNYYGAGSWGFNWMENQYDLILKPSSPGGATTVLKTIPELKGFSLDNLITTGEKGSGDNAYIYYPPYGSTGFATGTIPAGVENFRISGSLPHPPRQFGFQLRQFLARQKVPVKGQVKIYSDSLLKRKGVRKGMLLLDSIGSPTLDSMNYWFLKKSVNLYGEAFLKTMAYQKNRKGSTQSGASLLKAFWEDKGIDPVELNIKDGSGLSPGNRVTTHAQVFILQYAAKQEWYQGFYQGFPEYNEMKMKSGTIGGAKGFCGYHRSRDGKEYVFSFLVNNYNGSSAAIVRKMYRVLDEMKR
jgi:D-alanyl-D-alanine carboxypeptidase/D-alanyl-D-alanine-endopeptidase (penicillin-binding protein 4)